MVGPWKLDAEEMPQLTGGDDQRGSRGEPGHDGPR